jgi:DNA-binding NtrC family response regulator
MGIKIVYIDDEVDMRLMFFENFSSSDVVIKTFSDLTDISKRVESESPDIIFLDY